MKRRNFITLLGGAAVAWPLAARAQQADRMRRIGLLLSIAGDTPEAKARVAGFRQGLEKLGWTEGRNVLLDFRYASGAPTDQAKVLANELIAPQPDVLVAQTVLAAVLQQETRTIPIVFLSVGDPIGLGLVASLARPGGNLTGVMTFEASIAGKWLTMLKEVAPSLARAVFVGNPKTTTYDYYRRAVEAAASSLAIESVPGVVASAVDIERLMESVAHTPNSGLVVLPDPTNIIHQNHLVAMAARYAVPAVYDRREYVVAGGLMSYGIDRVDEFRQAASDVDRILRGTSPSDLPVQLPTRYQTVINLKTMKALNMTAPPILLVAADEVIE